MASTVLVTFYDNDGDGGVDKGGDTFDQQSTLIFIKVVKLI